MANEISSIASIRALSSAAKNSRQVAKTDVANLPGDSLPPEGRELPTRAANPAEISAAVSQINEIVQSIQRDLTFNLDEDSGQTVIRVMDSESGELIRQIPSEEALAIAMQLRDLQKDTVSQGDIGQGLLFSDRS